MMIKKGKKSIASMTMPETTAPKMVASTGMAAK